MDEHSGSGKSMGAEKGAFTVSSSRVPDLPKPNVASISTTKTVAKDIKERQR